MIDPLFDPYEALVNCQSDVAICSHNIQQLIHALNDTTGHLRDLSEQHAKMSKLISDSHRQIQQLKMEISLIKSNLSDKNQ